MPLSLSVDLLETSDVSTSATDFQQDGTAAPGATGRVADAGHVHPAGALGYQIVTQEVYGSNPNVTVDAPAGCVVVGGGYSINEGGFIPQINAPVADGSGWTVQGTYGEPSTITVYAICVNA